MSKILRVLIDAGPIKYPNGLWFYTIDFIEDLKRLGGHQIDLIYPRFATKNIEGTQSVSSLTGFLKSWFGAYSNVFVMTLAIRGYYRQMVFIHDLWPMIQPNLTKSILASLVSCFYRRLSKIITVSESHRKKLNVKYCLPNKMPKVNEENIPHIECDYLIIGTETTRKQVDKSILLIEKIQNYKNAGVGFGEVNSRHEQRKIVIVTSNHAIFASTCGISLVDPSDLGKVRPRNVRSMYISLSREEGFNRGAAFALSRGFKLILSDIPVHREFFSIASTLFLNQEKIESIHREEYVVEVLRHSLTRSDNHQEFEIISKSLERKRNYVLKNILLGI
jgi:hypothetical protein